MKWLAVLFCFTVLLSTFSFSNKQYNESTWIRINYLGYKPNGVKVAVWCSKEQQKLSLFELIDAATNKVVFIGKAGKAFGAYGPFTQTYRLDFSTFKKAGKYYLGT